MSEKGKHIAKVSREVAETEINKWLDFKCIKPRRRTDLKAAIDMLVDAVEDGDLILEKNNNLIHKLMMGIQNEEGEKTVGSLTYTPRVNVGLVHKKLKNVQHDDAEGRLIAYVSQLTGQPTAVIEAIDTTDFGIAQAIATFFL